MVVHQYKKENIYSSLKSNGIESALVTGFVTPNNNARDGLRRQISGKKYCNQRLSSKMGGDKKICHTSHTSAIPAPGILMGNGPGRQVWTVDWIFPVK